MKYEKNLKKAYGDFSRPNMSFVAKSFSAQPYSVVIQDLLKIEAVEDDTEVNCDVCFTYYMRSGRFLIIKLSMVGPYALVKYVDDERPGYSALMTAGNLKNSKDEKVVKTLLRHGIVLVPPGDLTSKVPLPLGEGGESATLYAALFEPDGNVDWNDIL